MSNNSPSLSPDVDGAEKALSQSMQATQVVTNYAQATRYALPLLQDPPPWFAPIQKHIDAAQEHAVNWVTNMCPVLTQSIPQGVVAFSKTFQKTGNKLVGILETLGGDKPTAKQREEVNSLMGQLVKEVGIQQATVQGMQPKIDTFQDQVKTTHQDLTTDIQTAVNEFSEGKRWVEALNTALEENFLKTTPAGNPCDVIVMIKESITLQVDSTGADANLITLVFCETFLKNQVANAQIEVAAVQGVLDSWVTLIKKYQAVADDLKNASDADFTDIMKAVDVQTAIDQWKQLETFARSLT